MSDDPTGRDLRVMWQTVVVIVIAVSAVVGGIISAVVWAVRHDARLEQVERWQAEKDRMAVRELWRREQQRDGRK